MTSGPPFSGSPSLTLASLLFLLTSPLLSPPLPSIPVFLSEPCEGSLQPAVASPLSPPCCTCSRLSLGQYRSAAFQPGVEPSPLRVHFLSCPKTYSDLGWSSVLHIPLTLTLSRLWLYEVLWPNCLIPGFGEGKVPPKSSLGAGAVPRRAAGASSPGLGCPFPTPEGKSPTGICPPSVLGRMGNVSQASSSWVLCFCFLFSCSAGNGTQGLPHVRQTF